VGALAAGASLVPVAAGFSLQPASATAAAIAIGKRDFVWMFMMAIRIV
jgi:hypothetical protein